MENFEIKKSDYLLAPVKQSVSAYWIFSSFFLPIVLTIITCGGAFAQTQDTTLPSADILKKLSLEELMDIEIEVTSVSKRPEKLTEVASAIQVITGDDIHRSGATNIIEALRLVSNLQVAQLNSFATIISARGFNAIFSNKLLVMIDGRTVYSPLFAGVYWDVQNVLLEDIERIEVVSGPGGTLWGANAVNGVINIITKNSKNTKGLYVSEATDQKNLSVFRQNGKLGANLNNFGAIRYGGNIGSNFSYRVYTQHFDRNNTTLPDGKFSLDNWNITQAGLRMDWNISKTSALLLQGNFYGGTERNSPITPSTLDGQNILGRWTRTFSDKSELILQAYFDRTWRRDIPSTFTDQLETYDLDFQHRFPLKKRHSILWGGGYRLILDRSQHSTLFVGFVPEKRNMPLISSFVQDEIMLVPEKLKFTIGTKLLHNVYTGFELQPSARMAWTPNRKNTIWSAVSRAVRTPSRIDVDYFIPTYPVPPGTPNVAGGPNFKSETVIAYEAGYRIQPTSKISFSLATFYNHYDDLYSVEALPGTLTYQIQNGTRGNSWGTELSGAGQVFKKWRLRGGYTYFYKKLENKPGRIYDFSTLGHDAEHQVLIQSIMDLPGNFQFDVTARYMGILVNYVPDYFTFDARLAWSFKKWVELSVVGQNLWQDKHKEFSTAQIPRSIYLKITCRY